MRHIGTLLASLMCVHPAVGAPELWLESPQLRPVLVPADLPRIISYLELDQAQADAAHVLLEDQLEQDAAAIESIRAALGEAEADEIDELEYLRGRWARAWDPRSAPATTAAGREQIRSLVNDYLEELQSHEPRPSEASQMLSQWQRARVESHELLLERIGLMLNKGQQQRWETALAGWGLARSPWLDLLPGERVDLDAVLVEMLGAAAHAPSWIERRAHWLRRIGAATLARDAVLMKTQGPLLDATARGQHGLVLQLMLERMAARRDLAARAGEVAEEMARALESVDTVNAFQRRVRSRMSPELWADDELDLRAAAALSIEGLDEEAREAVSAVAARHRSRRAAVQANLARHEAAAIERRMLRPVEHRLLVSLLGYRASLIGLDEEADLPLAETRRLESRLKDARGQARGELDEAIPDAHLADVDRMVRDQLRIRRQRSTAQPPGEAVISLPQAGTHESTP